MSPNMIMAKNPYTPRWAWATVYWVKWATSLKSLSDSIAPWALTAVYAIAPNTVNRRAGLYLSRWKLPSIVMWWLIATAMTGMNIIMLPTVLAVASQAGIGPPIRWCMPAQL